MKALVIATLFVISTLWGFSAEQPPAQETTKADSFESKHGTVLIRGFSEVGGLGSTWTGGTLTIEARELVDKSDGTRELGLLVHVIDGTRADSAFIEYDEIDSLIQGISFISTQTKAVTKLDSFEATYSTRGGLSVTVFNSTKDIKAAIEIGKIREVRRFVSLADLAKLKALIVKGKEKLDAIK